MQPDMALKRRADAGTFARACGRWGRRLAAAAPAVAVVMLLLSLGPLVSPALHDFFSPAELALAWFEHLAELAVIAAALLIGFIALDDALPGALPRRLFALCALLLALSASLSLLLHAYHAGGLAHTPPPLRILADSLRWGLPAVFLTLIADRHERALQADSAAHDVERARAQLQQAESEQQLALLQAQIEPHFLFNMLGNVRRLYRSQPRAGADAIGSLMRYLRTALPQLRSRQASLGEEIASVQAYLELFKLRMGAQLRFSIDVGAGLDDAEFPPMLLVTLVENAIKHGLEPAGGGHVEVRARRDGERLEVAVLDDAAGFGAAGTSGTGVGLVNIRRQLATRYPGEGRLILEARQPCGAGATITIPLARAPRSDDARPAAVCTPC